MTNWAIVAGTVTSGDGIGGDPILVALPHSKLIVNFPGEMGLNPDGSSNEEMNTIPDIQLTGKSPKDRLKELIKQIESKKII